MEDIVFKSDDLVVMSLINYFITEKNYNPMIIHGLNDEIWLENLNEDYGCYYKMIGKQVFIRAVSEKNVTLKAFATNIIGTLPDKYKPLVRK